MVRPAPADAPDYVSRGGHKLAGALDAFAAGGLEVAGRRCLDAGASTGGFTDVLLRRGAAHVVAVDVGYGQLAWSLQQDERVTVVDRTNVRELDAAAVGELVDVVVADLSFISLRLVLRPLRRRRAGRRRPRAHGQASVRGRPGAAGRRRGRPRSRRCARTPSARWSPPPSSWASAAGTSTASPLPGPSGNVEYFVWLRADAGPLDDDVLARAVAQGPP